MKNRITNIVALALLGVTVYFHLTIGISWWYYLLIFLAFSAIKAYGATVLSANFFITSRCKGSKQSGAIALTFDDGPVPGKTERILEILNHYQVKASFFCIGNRIAQNPELFKQIHEQGHLVGNHSFLHGKLFDLQSTEKMSNELQLTDAVIEKNIQVRPRFFRPPYGVTNPNLARAIRKGNYTSAGWSIRSMDTVVKDKERLLQSVTRKLKGGDIILFHDFSEATIAILPRVIEVITQRGLKVARLDVLLDERAYV